MKGYIARYRTSNGVNSAKRIDAVNREAAISKAKKVLFKGKFIGITPILPSNK